MFFSIIIYMSFNIVIIEFPSDAEPLACQSNFGVSLVYL